HRPWCWNCPLSQRICYTRRCVRLRASDLNTHRPLFWSSLARTTRSRDRHGPAVSSSGTSTIPIRPDKQLDNQLHTKQPNFCWHSGTLWDLVALYPKGTNWGKSEPLYIDGPVFKVETELQNQTSKLLQSLNATNVFSSKPVP